MSQHSNPRPLLQRLYRVFNDINCIALSFRVRKDEHDRAQEQADATAAADVDMAPAAVASTADVGAEHDVVLGVAIEACLVKTLGEDLEVATTAVNVLLMLHGELNDKILALVGKGLRKL